MVSGGDTMYKPEYGDPVVTLRLPKAMIAAGKQCARRHDTTLSGLIRRLLDDQLTQDGINWQIPPTPMPGQKGIDDYLLDEATNA